MVRFILVSLFVALTCSCTAKEPVKEVFTLGCERSDYYLPSLKGKKVGLVVNHTSLVKGVHLVDTLLSCGVSINAIFAPEHGFRGKADAGAYVVDSLDATTGIQIYSLYGKNKKPSLAQLKGLDVVIFDIQDVGVRFYTYISTMHYMMESCAENKVKMMVFDRPNPNGAYIDGPVLEKGFTSFVGMHPIPILHGLTVGELALMINGQKWLKEGVSCDLTVVPMLGYVHTMPYSLPVKPSPNLPNDLSIRLYPSLCLFEGTDVSVGRGTEYPFQVIGYPDARYGQFTFTPKSIQGMASQPLHQNKLCYGYDFRKDTIIHGFSLKWLLTYYQVSGKGEAFFYKNGFFNLLAGTDQLKKQIVSGMTEEAIRASWQTDLSAYKLIRTNYLLYP